MKNNLLLIFCFCFFIITNVNAQYGPVTYHLQKSKSLSKISSDPTPAGNSIQEIIIIGDTILTSSRGLNISTDGGTSWQNFYGTSDFGSDGVYSIGYDDGVIWAATGQRYYDSDLQQSIDKGTGYRVSTDMGNTWRTILQPVDSDSDTIIVYGINNLRALPVTVTDQNVTFDLAFTQGTVWAASFAAGLRKSTDNGQTWQRVVLPADYLEHISPSDTLNYCYSPVAGSVCSQGFLNLEGFSVLAVDDTTLYVGTAGGINKSTDGGISWTKFSHGSQQNSISGNWVTFLDYNLSNNTVWASTWRAEGPDELYGISATSDGGTNWSVYLPDVRSYNFGFKGNQVIASTDDGAFRSSDDGRTWILPTSIYDSESKVKLTTTIFYDAGVNGNTIWLGSEQGLVKLNETGGMWQGNWKIFRASSNLESNDMTYAFPNPFLPKTTTNKVEIVYSTGGNSVPVTIRIFDFGMNYVRTIIQNVTKGSSSNLSERDYWDGKDDNGNLVSNGVYFYRIDRGSSEPIFGKILVIK
ncbi:MAG TPA: hypothetical protein VKA26_13845 [Ignavibacteriaceae bacterium]|nr:hypothetical protein [Ignavibacteriaceae bacterium]